MAQLSQCLHKRHALDIADSAPELTDCEQQATIGPEWETYLDDADIRFLVRLVHGNL